MSVNLTSYEIKTGIKCFFVILRDLPFFGHSVKHIPVLLTIVKIGALAIF